MERIYRQPQTSYVSIQNLFLCFSCRKFFEGFVYSFQEFSARPIKNDRYCKRELHLFLNKYKIYVLTKFTNKENNHLKI